MSPTRKAERSQVARSRDGHASSSSFHVARRTIERIMQRYGVPLLMLSSTCIFYILSAHLPDVTEHLPFLGHTGEVLLVLCILLSAIVYLADANSQRENDRLRELVDTSRKAGRVKDSQMRALTDDSNLPILMLAPNGQCCYANKAFSILTSSNLRKVAGHGWKDFFAKSDFESLFKGWIHTRDAKQTFSMQVEIDCGNTRKPVNVLMTPSLHEEEYVCTIISIFLTPARAFSDTTELKSKAITLDDVASDSFPLSEFKKRLAFPLHRIFKGICRMLTQTIENQILNHSAQSIKSDIEQMMAILEDASISKLTNNPNDYLGATEFNPHDFALSIDEEISDWTANKRIAIGVEIDESLPQKLIADAARIREVVLILIDQSIQNTERGGIKVIFSFLPNEDRLSIDLIDTGKGITAERLKKMQSGEAESNDNSDSLSLACALVRAMNGIFEIESLEKRGNVVQLLIPAREDNLRPVEEPSVTSSPSAAYQRGCQVLILGEDPHERRLLEEILRDIGIESSATDDYQEALNNLGTGKFNLVILNSDVEARAASRFTELLKENHESIPVVRMRKDAVDSEPTFASNSENTGMLSASPNADEIHALISQLMTKQ